jgi:hypothetical protein
MALAGSTPVIVLTGYENFSFSVRSLALGVSDYILKDELTPQLLHKSILYSIERKKLHADLLTHVNASKAQNDKFREIAWIQSHVVRAPLARIMALIDLFDIAKDDDMDERTILDYLMASAKELDEAVKNITAKVYCGDNDLEPELQ